MSSILTNTSAMVALQTMRGINMNMAQTQSEISTGKSIATAKDNASIWAISKVMESDVKGFNTISSNLALGESTVSVARAAAETVTDLLTDIKGKIVDAQQDNKDRGKIQTDINALRDQVKSVVSAAQFNGLNLVDGLMTDQNQSGETGIDVLSSLDRAGDGSVASGQISINAANLSTTTGTDLKPDAMLVTDGGIDVEHEGSFTVDLSAFGTLIEDEEITITFTDSGGTVLGTVNAQAPATPTEDNFATAIETAFNGVTALADEGWELEIDGSKLTFTNGEAADTATNPNDTYSVTVTGTDAGADDDEGTAPDNVALSTGQLVTNVTDADGNETNGMTIRSGETISLNITNIKFQANNPTNQNIGPNALARDSSDVDLSRDTALVEGDELKLNIGSFGARYTVKEGDTSQSIVAGLKNSLVESGINEDDFTISLSQAGVLTVKNNTNESVGYSAGGTRGAGALAGLETLSVETKESAQDALANIEGMIDAAIQASADFGSAQGRLETQQSFVSKLTDSLRAGIGSLVDADMEETSARLQSLQVQQQLGVQALSIANQQPQMLLSLFR